MTLAMAADEHLRDPRRAATLLRAALAHDMGLPVLASRLAGQVLAEAPACHWAALLAAEADASPEARRRLLLAMGDNGGAAAAAIRAAVLLQEGRCEKAAEVYCAAAIAMSDAPDLLLKQAVALEQAGHTRRALEIYLRLRQSPDARVAATASNNAAYLTAEFFPNDAEKLRQAHQWAGEAVRIAPAMATFRDTKGWLAHLLGDGDEARRELRLAVKAQPDRWEIHEHLAAAEEAAGHAELAGWHRQAARRLRQAQGGRGAPAGEGRPAAPAEHAAAAAAAS